MRDTRRNEDVGSIGIIVTSALVGVTAVGALLAMQSDPGPPAHVEIQVPRSPVMTTGPFESGSGFADRIYGTVVTRSGDTFRGYLRWDSNEGSWTDLLEGKKANRRQPTSAVRFGHLRRIERVGSGLADVTLRSGETVRLKSDRTDIGSANRGIRVDDPERGRVGLSWSNLRSVEFEPAPDGTPEPVGRRLYGTLVTTSGLEFTGHVAWDVEEIYTTDVLDGEDSRGVDREIPFGEVASISRLGRSAAAVVLQNGEEVVLRDSDDVSSGNGGITVSDPGLGQVRVDWGDFVTVRFSETEAIAARSDFDGGRPLRGTLRTRSGETFAGTLEWDLDEARSWEVLDGEYEGVTFQIEFGKIAAIRRSGRGAGMVAVKNGVAVLTSGGEDTLVELTDGRTFVLSGSNDVNGGNEGILVQDGDTVYNVGWNDFAEVRFQHR